MLRNALLRKWAGWRIRGHSLGKGKDLSYPFGFGARDSRIINRMRPIRGGRVLLFHAITDGCDLDRLGTKGRNLSMVWAA